MAESPVPVNTKSPMLVTLSGMMISVKLKQFSNTLDSMVVTVLGIVTVSKLEQWAKKELPNVWIPSGRDTVLRLVQQLNMH